MLYIDDRIGSAEFAPAFANFGIKTELTRLDYGDFFFTGNGPNGECGIGIERKELNDLLACIRDGRFSGHQLIGLLNNYHRVVLLVEGVWRPGDDGILEERRNGRWQPTRGKFMYRELAAYLMTMREICGLQIERSISEYETVVQVATWYKWYAKEWSEHSGHKIIHNRPFINEGNYRRTVQLEEPPLIRRVAAQLDGIASKKSDLVADHFGTVYNMVTAEKEDWMQIKGISKKIAGDVIADLRGEPRPVPKPKKVKEVKE